MKTVSTDRRVIVHPPVRGGTYYRDFGWRVTIDGVTACSGNEAQTKRYARVMRRRFRDEQA